LNSRSTPLLETAYGLCVACIIDRQISHPVTIAAGLNDFHAYNPATLTWFDLSDNALGTPPTVRHRHGFTSAGGKLYLHGGINEQDGERARSIPTSTFVYSLNNWEFSTIGCFDGFARHGDRLLRIAPAQDNAFEKQNHAMV
jgi:hypothetical protein